jgi:putative SOS response-associated peptidase YedK
MERLAELFGVLWAAPRIENMSDDDVHETVGIGVAEREDGATGATSEGRRRRRAVPGEESTPPGANSDARSRSRADEARDGLIPAPPPSYNIAPTHLVTVITESAEGEGGAPPADDADPTPATTRRRRFGRFRWGLVPSWADDPAIGNKLINARGETIAEKPSFRAAFRERRCLILADGFFEWRVIEGRRRPLYIRLRSHEPFAMAGLWEEWRRPAAAAGGSAARAGTAAGALARRREEDRRSVTQDLFAAWEGEDGDGAAHHSAPDADAARPAAPTSGHELITAEAPLRSCTIVTTSANELMSRFHHRMPVILPPEAWDAWLAPDTPPQDLHALIRPYPAALMEYHDVAMFVNSPRNNAPACLAPTSPAVTFEGEAEPGEAARGEAARSKAAAGDGAG